MSAYFEEVERSRSLVRLRRHTRVSVVACGSGPRRCKGCAALREQLGRHACVAAVSFVRSGDCHSSLRVLDADGRRDLGGCDDLGRDRALVARLNRLFKVRRPFRPLRHQRDLVRALEGRTPNLLLAFSMGSGKTHAALAVLDAAGETKVDVVAPLSLLDQWEASVRCHSGRPGQAAAVDYTLRSPERLKSEARVGLLRDRAVVVDEAHRYRNQTDSMEPSLACLSRARRVLLLTGTPLHGRPSDGGVVLRLLGLGAEVSDPSEFARRLHGAVACYDPRMCESAAVLARRYPRLRWRTVEHAVGWEQALALSLHGSGMTVDVGGVRVQSSAHGGALVRLSMLTAVPCPLGSGKVFSSKAEACAREVLRRPYPQLAFSRFKAHLLSPLAERLRARGAKVRLLTGDTSTADRAENCRAYNRGDVDVLLVCRVGAEGLDLTARTHAVHILEPHDAVAGERQVAARVCRYVRGGRAPAAAPEVAILRYVARYPEGAPTAAQMRHFAAEGERVLGDASPGADGLLRHVRAAIRRDGGLTDEQRLSERARRSHRELRPWRLALWDSSILPARHARMRRLRERVSRRGRGGGTRRGPGQSPAS